MEVGRKIESYHLLVHVQTSQNNKSWAWVWARTRDYNIIHNSHVSGRNPITWAVDIAAQGLHLLKAGIKG